MPGYQGRFIDALAKHCREVVCFLHTPVEDEVGRTDYTVASPNVRLVSIGPHSSVPSRLLKAHKYMRQVSCARSELDVILLRGPSPLLPLLAHAVRPIPTALLIVGDNLEGVKDLQQPNWRRQLIRLFWMLNQWGQRQIARRSLVFVNSRKLYRKMLPFAGRLIETRTTTLHAADVYEREDTCKGSPKHLLYTGRIDRSKGLLEIVQAVAVLSAKGEDVVLDLVGWPDSDSSILRDVRQLSVSLGIADRVRYHGFKPLGPDLYAYYRAADVYVLASTHEGFPRTIWEAMAHSLPVVVTRVGSIPDFVGDAAELVEPRQADVLASAILRVLHDSKRRREMIRKGLELVRENTLENQCGVMISEIAAYVRRC